VRQHAGEIAVRLVAFDAETFALYADRLATG